MVALKSGNNTNPYSVESINSFYKDACVEYDLPYQGLIEANERFVRFLIKSTDELCYLADAGILLFEDTQNTGFGYGCYSDLENSPYICCQYGNIPMEFDNNGIQYEVLDYCIYDSQDNTDERIRLAISYAHSLKEIHTKIPDEPIIDDGGGTEDGGGTAPIRYSGTINVEVNSVIDPVKGVRVILRDGSNARYCYTDGNGRYFFRSQFIGTPSYELEFYNEKTFKISQDIHVFDIPRSEPIPSPSTNLNAVTNISVSSNSNLYELCAVNNAAYEWYTYCRPTIALTNVTPPYNGLHIWTSSCSLLGTYWGCTSLFGQGILQTIHDSPTDIVNLVTNYYHAAPVLQSLVSGLPDVMVKVPNSLGYYRIYEIVTHELAHVSHAAGIGIQNWAPAFKQEFSNLADSIITNPYGDGSEPNADLVALTECWAYHMGISRATIKKDLLEEEPLYQNYPSSLWFDPTIFKALNNIGINNSVIFSIIKRGLTSISSLRPYFLEYADSRENITRAMVNDVFDEYGY